jgi:peptidyl-prolyl cis-trans isomerase A (cyclophilin A)
MIRRLALSVVLLSTACSPGVRADRAEAEQRIHRLESNNDRLERALARAQQEIDALRDEASTLRLRQALAIAGIERGQEIRARFVTSEGTMVFELASQLAPRTVANFVALAEGSSPWVDPRDGQSREGVPLYDGTTIHRVVPDYVIQGGDPLGTSEGGPGYSFEDEFHRELRHDRAGILSMANNGPDSNGSQFFVTLAPRPELDGFDANDKPKPCQERGVSCHSVFGHLLEGLDVLQAIGSMTTDERERPLKEVIVRKVVIERGPEAG